MVKRLTAASYIALLTSSFFVFYGVFIHAQDEETQSDEEYIEEVTVTGSHIKGAVEDAALPVTSLSRDDLIQEGTPSTLDLIKNLSFSQGADGETDQFQAGAGADRATVNIRGLGPSRSLVLINGERTTWSPHAIGAQAQLLVDVNILPSIALSRIDFLRDGAAATYGSDAIAGVMNYITRSDFVGFEISGNHKMVQEADGDTEVGFIWGSDQVFDGRAHLVSSYSYIQRSELELVDRDWAVRPYAESPLGGWSATGRPAVFVPYDKYDQTGGGFGGLLVTGVVDPSCETLGGAHTSAGLGGNTIGGFCRFQYTAFDNLAEEGQRWQWFNELSMDISDTTVFTGDLLITNSQVPAWNTSPSYPPNRLVNRDRVIRANNPGLVDMARQFAGHATHGSAYGPYASCDESYCLYDGDAWDPVAFVYGRFYAQDGPLRDHKRENSLIRITGDLTGSREAYDWRLAAGYSSSERESLGGDTMTYRDLRGVEGLAGHECERMVPNEYNADGQLEFSLETLQANAGQGPCSYWIPFSNGMWGSHEQVLNGTSANPTFNPDLDNRGINNYMMTTLGGEGETSLLYLEGVVSGTLTDVMFDEVNYALGAQWRSESYYSDVLPGGLNDGDEYPCSAGPEIKDCATGRTGLFGFLPPGFNINQTRNIQSIFGEANVPLDENLEFSASARFENYGGDTGQSFDPKVAVRWQAVPWLGLRASLGSTFRGPTLNQTVPDNSSNSLQYVGVTGAFKRVDTKGNPELEPETATTVNVGAIVNMDSFNGGGVFATLDYWSYDFKKPLVTEPFNAIVGAACPAGAAECDASNEYFDRLTFGGNPTATDIEIIDINIVNGPDIKTTGIDASGRIDYPMGGNVLSVGTSLTRILSYDISSWRLGGEYDALGRLNYGTSLARTLVELKGRVYVNYSLPSINVRLTTNYIDDYLHNIGGNDTEIESQMTYDLTVAWTNNDDSLSVWGGAINLTDEDPPWMRREMNYDAFTHNPFGQIIKFGATYRM